MEQKDINKTALSKFEVVEECHRCTTKTPTEERPWFRKNCPNCNGTGKITRDATDEEMVEAVEFMFENYSFGGSYHALKSGAELRLRGE